MSDIVCAACGQPMYAGEMHSCDIARLRARIAQWTEVYNQCDKSRDAAMDELAEAKAEIERLQAALRAANEAYEKQSHATKGMQGAKIERLQAALRFVLDCPDLNEGRDHARAALEGKK